MLPEGAWLIKDRIRKTETWKKANKYNLSTEHGNLQYTNTRQVHDFYLWFDEERKKVGIKINAIGILAIVAGQLSHLENPFIHKIMVRKKEILWFGHEGSKKVLEYVFPLLKDLYLSSNRLNEQEAENWDMDYLKKEQCDIVEDFYQKLSPKSVQQLERMAKGTGLYSLGIKKELKFEGDIRDCESRYEHAVSKLYPYYLRSQ